MTDSICQEDGSVIYFNYPECISPDMQCHYCDRSADVTAESGHLRVGLCEEHFRERLDELAEADLVELRKQLDLD